MHAHPIYFIGFLNYRLIDAFCLFAFKLTWLNSPSLGSRTAHVDPFSRNLYHSFGLSLCAVPLHLRLGIAWRLVTNVIALFYSGCALER